MPSSSFLALSKLSQKIKAYDESAKELIAVKVKSSILPGHIDLVAYLKVAQNNCLPPKITPFSIPPGSCLCFSTRLYSNYRTGRSLLKAHFRYLGIEVDDALEISEQIEI